MKIIRSDVFSELELLLAAGGLADLGSRQRPEALPLAKLNERIDLVLLNAEMSERLTGLIRGMLLLWHDHLDAAHAIAQDIEDADGSLLHGMMHRREPDYSNAKYWFRRAGEHPCHAKLGHEVSALLNSTDSQLAARIMPQGAWNACGFVDACEEAAQGRAMGLRERLQAIQRIEFAAFLEHLCSNHS